MVVTTNRHDNEKHAAQLKLRSEMNRPIKHTVGSESMESIDFQSSGVDSFDSIDFKV